MTADKKKIRQVMSVDAKPRTMEAELQARRRQLRDAPAPVLVDKARVLAHLQAQLALLKASEEVTHGVA